MSTPAERVPAGWPYAALALLLSGCFGDSPGPSITAPNGAPDHSVAPSALVQVSDLTAASGRSYVAVTGGMSVGARVYTDRTFTWETLPALLEGLTYIQTSMNDKEVSDDPDFLSFRIDREATLYVAYAGTAPPAWLADNFTATGLTVVMRKSLGRVTFNLYSTTVPAGVVTLGSNLPGDGVNDMYALVLAAVNTTPVAVVGGPYTGTAGVEVHFDGSGSSDPDGNLPLSYAWDFGDGATGSGAQPMHQYASAGTYTVSLVVTDSSGNASAPSTTTAIIESAPPPSGGGGTPVVVWDIRAASGRTYAGVEGGLQNGASVYSGRAWTYDNVPASLRGQTYIQTNTADDTIAGNNFLTFRVNRETVVHVAYAGPTLPSWMSDFTPTGESVVVVRSATIRVTHRLYARTFPAGQVTLGGNQASGTEGMYTVILPPAPGARGPWVAVGMGWYHSCAIDISGSAWCWGFNSSGRLGLGHTDDVLVPTPVVGGLTFSSISGGSNFTCAVTTIGDGYCWGNNDGGQLGNGATGSSSRPMPVAGGLKFRKIHAGQWHACGLTTDGATYCWGRNNRGQNGSNSPSSEVIRTPRLVSGGYVWQAIGVGHNHSCGVTVAGDAYCWGQNRVGSVGDDTFTDRRVPRQVVGGLVFGSTVLEMSIDGGQNDTCAVGNTGRAHCWGDQWHNQLGTNVGRDESPRPTTVAGVPDFNRITVGGDHACGLTSLGETWCWGDNTRWAQAMEEQLDYTPPHKIATNYRFETLSGGWDHYCGVTTEGDLVCWGWNKYGQIGDGTLIRRYDPVLILFP